MPSGPQGGDEFFSDRGSIGLPPRLLHDFAHEATHGSIFPGGKVLGSLGMGLDGCSHPGIHRAFISDLQQAFAFRDFGRIGFFLAEQAENGFHGV